MYNQYTYRSAQNLKYTNNTLKNVLSVRYHLIVLFKSIYSKN